MWPNPGEDAWNWTLAAFIPRISALVLMNSAMNNSIYIIWFILGVNSTDHAHTLTVITDCHLNASFVEISRIHSLLVFSCVCSSGCPSTPATRPSECTACCFWRWVWQLCVTFCSRAMVCVHRKHTCDSQQAEADKWLYTLLKKEEKGWKMIGVKPNDGPSLRFTFCNVQYEYWDMHVWPLNC